MSEELCAPTELTIRLQSLLRSTPEAKRREPNRTIQFALNGGDIEIVCNSQSVRRLASSLLSIVGANFDENWELTG